MCPAMTTATSDLSRAFARQIADRKLELPTMPGTATEVMAACQKENTDAAKLSAILHRDPALASSVLRVASSAAYAGRVPCASLQQAVSRLGLQLVVEIATAVAVRGRLFTDPKCAELLAALWRHSVVAGFYSKEIARLRRQDVETAFLCGLLHDVGKALLLDNLDRTVGRTGAVPAAYLAHAVDEQHVEAGVLLAEAWQLPPQVIAAVRAHHDPAAETRFPATAMMVALADRIAHFVAPGPLGAVPAERELREHPALPFLDLYPDQLQELLGMRDRALLVTEGLR